MATAVISTIGEDRPGIVAELSKLVRDLGLNIEDSRMTVLGGEFAVLMAVTGGQPALNTLAEQLNQFADASGIAHLFRQTSERAPGAGSRCRVAVEALDHPGIVQGVAAFFSDRGANVRELATDTQRAAHTGAPVFSLTMALELPEGLETATLTEAFADFCAANDLDGTLEP